MRYLNVTDLPMHRQDRIAGIVRRSLAEPGAYREYHGLRLRFDRSVISVPAFGNEYRILFREGFDGAPALAFCGILTHQDYNKALEAQRCSITPMDPEYPASGTRLVIPPLPSPHGNDDTTTTQGDHMHKSNGHHPPAQSSAPPPPAVAVVAPKVTAKRRTQRPRNSNAAAEMLAYAKSAETVTPQALAIGANVGRKTADKGLTRMLREGQILRVRYGVYRWAGGLAAPPAPQAPMAAAPAPVAASGAPNPAPPARAPQAAPQGPEQAALRSHADGILDHVAAMLDLAAGPALARATPEQLAATFSVEQLIQALSIKTRGG